MRTVEYSQICCSHGTAQNDVRRSVALPPAAAETRSVAQPSTARSPARPSMSCIHTGHDKHIRVLELPLPSRTVGQVDRRRTATLRDPERGLPGDEVPLLFDQSDLGDKEDDDFAQPSVPGRYPLDEQRTDVRLATPCIQRSDNIAALGPREDLLLVLARQQDVADVLQCDSHGEYRATVSIGRG